MVNIEEWGFTPRRWETELSKPEPSSPIYLRASTLKNLKYTLGHLTNEQEDQSVTLDEAVDGLCNAWIATSNAKDSCERRHKPFEKLMLKERKKRHRKCTKNKCKRDDYDLCPTYEW